MSIISRLQSLQFNKQARALTLASATFSLAIAGLIAGNLPTSQSSAHAASILVTKPAQVSMCTGCHAADLKGRQGFSPGVTKSGILKKYTMKTFEAVMNTGKTPSGGMVKPPMKVYGYTPKISDAMYKYFLTLP